ncbi:MAG: hypothetical protein RIR73_1217 [Chloroflexota bacterium]
MHRFSHIYFLVVMLFVASIACSFPGQVIFDTDMISTAAAQTVIASLTGIAPQETSSLASSTPLPPTLTSTITLTFTPVFTATSTIAQVTVSVDTNCRVGPGVVYARVGALLVGEVAEVVGRDPTGKYWFIRNPDSNSGFCWLWGEYAVLTGSFQNLPIFTPPPTPIQTFTPTFTPTFTSTPTSSPNFTLSYDGLDTCSGWWLEVRVKNTGSLPFRSMEFIIKDTVTGVRHTAVTNGFEDLDGCSSNTSKDVIVSGDEFVISSPIYSYDPSGNKMRVSLTLCNRNNQKGTCVNRSLIFQP